MIFGVMLVRNEVDIVRINLLHHLARGVDHILVADNGSTDGTLAILEELTATRRVHVISRPGAFHQAETATELAREAFLRGARWVLPIDADEFWHAAGGQLRDILDDSGDDAGALEVEVVNFVQRREQEVLEPRALLTMTRRVPQPIGTSAEADVLVESGRISFVECCYPPKHILRGSIGLQIAQGNHRAGGLSGCITKTAAIRCLHAPLRSRAGLLQKVDPARPVKEISRYLEPCWHLRRWRRLAFVNRLDAEWAANSYLDDCLDVSGEQHALAIDTTLRDLVMPWIDRSTASVRESLLPLRSNRQPQPPLLPLDPADIGKILAVMRNVEGWLRNEEAELLIHLTRRAVVENASAVVEVGSFCGKSTIVLASAAKTVSVDARIYAIDPHQGEVGAEDTIAGVERRRPTFERFLQNIEGAGVADVIEPIRRRSYEVPWRLPIALLFVDGLHDYASVARDFFHFEPQLAIGGYVAFHDYGDDYPGVRTFVAGLAADDAFNEVARAASLVVLQKVADLPQGPPGDIAGGMMALSRRLAQQQNGIEFLIREMSARDQTLRAREEGIEWLRSVVRDKEMTISELEKGVAWLRKEIAERDLRLEALQRAAE